MTGEDRPLFEERLPAPAVLWISTLVIEGTFALALGVALGAYVGWSLLVVSWAVTGWALVRSAGRIQVAAGQLLVGPARLPVTAAGAVTVLDAQEARQLRGPLADPNAFLWLKGWVPTAVRVDVVDPDDPTPYWYVSTRRPRELAEAIEQSRRPAR